MALNLQVPAWLQERTGPFDQAPTQQFALGAQIAQRAQQIQQENRVLQLREEHFRLQREELERIAEGTVAASAVFSEMGRVGDYTDPELQSKFWATVQKYPKFTRSPAFKDMVDTLQSAALAKTRMEQIAVTHDLRSEEIDQRHANRLNELETQYQNLLQRDDLRQEDRIAIEKLQQQLAIERDALKPTTQRPERFDLDRSDEIEYNAKVDGLKEWLKAQPTNRKDPDAPYRQYTERLNALNKEFEPRKKKRVVGEPVGKVSTKQNFDEYYRSLPVGAEYVAPDGVKRIKR